MLRIDGKNLSLEDVVMVAKDRKKVALEKPAAEKIAQNRFYLEEQMKNGETIYGINTGFGHLSRVTISPCELETLQQKLVYSHSVGYGEDLDEETVRAVMLLRANALAQGFSGVRIQVVEKLLDFLNHGIHPRVPSRGSVGASGDLVPLAHVALALTGNGQVYYQGKLVDTKEALKKENLMPLQLMAKEGLALVNGTQVMTALGLIAVHEGLKILRQADCIAALSMEALRGLRDPFHPLIQKVRPHPGQKKVAENILTLMEGSENLEGNCNDKVQDGYSLRCIPQIHGASRDVLEYVLDLLIREANSATDNPLIFHEEDRIISGGNFHGQPLALALDYLGMAMSEIGNVSERRLERLINPALSGGLPPFLVNKSGLNSGYMVLQYTAASLVSENKVLAGPASIDSIPTSASQEDHVSMGSVSALKLKNINSNLLGILAGEALCAVQGIDMAGLERMGRGTRLLHSFLREKVPFLEEDRTLYGELELVSSLLKEGALLRVLQDGECFLL